MPFGKVKFTVIERAYGVLLWLPGRHAPVPPALAAGAAPPLFERRDTAFALGSRLICPGKRSPFLPDPLLPHQATIPPAVGMPQLERTSLGALTNFERFLRWVTPATHHRDKRCVVLPPLTIA